MPEGVESIGCSISTNGVQKKKSETASDVKKVPTAAVGKACRVINFTLSIQVSRGYHLFASDNDSRESCSKSPSQI